MAAKDDRTTPGPGTRRDPKRKIVYRWFLGNSRYARLECGHEVQCPKSIDHREGVGVHCGTCGRKSA